jgi:peptide/nickel transport system ATP-binding protein
MPLLDVKDLVKKFPIKGGLFGRTKGYVHAVSGVSLSLERGETLGLVGESGSGKTTLARTVLRLLVPDAGKIFFDGQDLTKVSARRLRHLRKDLQLIFQDPYSSLNPRMDVGNILTEGLKIHGVGNPRSRREKAAELLQKVGLSPDAMGKYPHEFSGGQRQRIGIARALSLIPRLIVCDEPVSALDVSVQAQVLNLLMDLKKEFGLTYLFISHDLKVVRHISDRITVIYLGKVMESLPASDLFSSRHPYTQALLQAIPLPDPGARKNRVLLKGEIPSPIHPPSGCVFRTRCPYAEEICKQEIPVLRELKSGHRVACHLAEKIPLMEAPR